MWIRFKPANALCSSSKCERISSSAKSFYKNTSNLLTIANRKCETKIDSFQPRKSKSSLKHKNIIYYVYFQSNRILFLILFVYRHFAFQLLACSTLRFTFRCCFEFLLEIFFLLFILLFVKNAGYFERKSH